MVRRGEIAMRHNSRIWPLLALLLIVAVAAGCSTANPTTAPPAPPNGAAAEKQLPKSQPAVDTMRVTVYFATKDAMYLVPETRTIAKNSHPAHSAIELLLGKPENPALVRVLPAGVKLRNLTIKDHIAYVDFNDKLIKNGSGGSAGEILAVGAIVDTLTEFADIEKVQIMVEGKKIDTLYGHLDTGEPLSRSASIIKK